VGVRPDVGSLEVCIALLERNAFLKLEGRNFGNIVAKWLATGHRSTSHVCAKNYLSLKEGLYYKNIFTP
jgi:hypothetical protein